MLQYGSRLEIHYWEYLVLLLYVVLLFLFFSRRKRLKVKSQPEYKYFVIGMFAKVVGGFTFSLLYFYWFPGGDTISYFYSSVPMVKLLQTDPVAFLHVLFGENTIESRNVFTDATGRPFMYIYLDDRQFMVVRLVTFFTLIGLNSFLITTVIFSTFTFIGIWRLYQTLYRYFPRLHKELAIAVLLLPNVLVWGSSIIKDSITFSAFCFVIHAVDNLWFRKTDQVRSAIILIVGSTLIIWIKSYIFMCLMPVMVIWISYARISRIKNAAIKIIVLPVGVVIVMAGILAVLSAFGEQFGAFSLDNALTNILSVQRDLANNPEYGTNSFNVGTMEPTWTSVLSKAPIALPAALFRPFVTECTNFVMLLSGIENLLVLGLFIRVLFKSRLVFFGSALVGNPLVLVCFSFAILYGFVTGITTPNFGALVRFKIPLQPLFVSGMFIVLFLLKERNRKRGRGETFRFENYRDGDPSVPRGKDGMPVPGYKLQ